MASTEHNVVAQSSLQQQGGWSLSGDGRRREFEKKVGSAPGFGRSDVLTLTLDLTGEASLFVSINGDPEKLLFNNMLARFNGMDKIGFTPAVALYGRGKVCFLGFH